MLIITADRAPALLDQHEDQMIHQNSMFQNVAKFITNLPWINSALDEWQCNRLINEALLELRHHGDGPVQINIPINEHTDPFKTPSVPNVRKISRFTLEDSNYIFEETAKLLKDKRILIIFGEGFPLSDTQKESLNSFIQRFGAVVLADKMSNCHGEGIIENSFSLIGALSSADVKELSPDVVISIRSNYSFNPESKGLINRFSAQRKVTNWYVSASGKIIDPFHRLSRVYEMDEFTFFSKVAQFAEWNDPDCVYQDVWTTLSESIDEPEVEYSHLYTVGKFLKSLPKNSVLNIANSNSIRLAQLYKFDDSIEVHCNRGTDGIDGSMSSMIGYAAASPEKLVFLMIGDLSFFYDMNSLWTRHLGKNVRILLSNNGGGAIMHMPKRPDFAAEHLPNFISAKHNASAKAWAIDRGFKYLSAHTKEEVQENIQKLTNPMEDGPIILEVFTDMFSDTRILKSYYTTVKRKTLEDKLRSKGTVVKKKIFSIMGW